VSSKKKKEEMPPRNPSLMLMSSESLFSRREIGSDIFSLQTIHRQQEEVGPV